MIVKLRAQQRPQLGERVGSGALQRTQIAAGERGLERDERRAARGRIAAAVGLDDAGFGDDEVAPGREPRRALGPPAPLPEVLDARAQPDEALEALVADLVLVRSQGCGPPQTSSRKTISVASERRGPSLRMRV